MAESTKPARKVGAKGNFLWDGERGLSPDLFKPMRWLQVGEEVRPELNLKRGGSKEVLATKSLGNKRRSQESSLLFVCPSTKSVWS